MPALLQRLLALAGLAAAAPALAGIALLVRMDSRGPVVYRALRIGRSAKAFSCLKFRTMAWSPTEAGPGISRASDPRVTRVGRRLRRYRLDELPQLWNVVRGEMLLVGPRPEDPRFVDMTNSVHRYVFSAVPGVTGLAQLAFADETRWLGDVDPEDAYRRIVQPAKLAFDRAYLRRRSVRLDLWVLRETVRTVAGRQPTIDEIRAVVGDEGLSLPAAGNQPPVL